MVRFALLLLSVQLWGASIVIDAGSPTDTFAIGGLAYSVPASIDKTVRMSSCSPTCAGQNPFSYHVPVENIQYLVEFGFQEASTGTPTRVFNVFINGQLALGNMTLAPASFGEVVRSVLASGIGGFMDIRFDSLRRSAIVSWIRLTPFVPTVQHLSGMAASQPNGTFTLTPFNPVAAVVNLACYRNGAPVALGTDYALGQAQVTPSPTYVVIAPKTPWKPTDRVTCEYDQGISSTFAVSSDGTLAQFQDITIRSTGVSGAIEARVYGGTPNFNVIGRFADFIFSGYGFGACCPSGAVAFDDAPVSTVRLEMGRFAK